MTSKGGSLFVEDALEIFIGEIIYAVLALL